MTISGIYQIRNIENNHIYVGRSSNLRKREYDHFYYLRHKNHCNRYLQNAYNKYGEDKFVFEIIEFCEIDDLFMLEQHYIDILNPEYNIEKEFRMTECGMQIKRSEETRDKISKALRKLHNSPEDTRPVCKDCGIRINTSKKDLFHCQLHYDHRMITYGKIDEREL